jgi:hypothetical protein
LGNARLVVRKPLNLSWKCWVFIGNYVAGCFLNARSVAFSIHKHSFVAPLFRKLITWFVLYNQQKSLYLTRWPPRNQSSVYYFWTVHLTTGDYTWRRELYHVQMISCVHYTCGIDFPQIYLTISVNLTSVLIKEMWSLVGVTFTIIKLTIFCYKSQKETFSELSFDRVWSENVMNRRFTEIVKYICVVIIPK